MSNFIEAHWVEWLVGVAGFICAWLFTHFFGAPILEFRRDRKDMILIAEEHALVGRYAGQQHIKDAQKALGQAASKSSYYENGAPLMVRFYCLTFFYNRHLAAGALRGLLRMVGSDSYSDEMRRNTLDTLKYALNADHRMSRARKEEIRHYIKEFKGL